MAKWDNLRKTARNQTLIKFKEDNLGLSYQEIGALFKISRQRAYQIYQERRDKMAKDTHPLAGFRIDAANNIVKFKGANYRSQTLADGVIIALKDKLAHIYELEMTLVQFIKGLPDHPNKTLILGILKPEKEVKK